MITQMTDKMIDDIVSSNRTFIIVFYSTTLPNYDDVIKVFEKYDEQFKGKIDIYKVDYDVEDKISSYFKMNILPAMVMMKNNKAYANSAGPISNIQYDEMIKTGLVEIMEDEKKIDDIDVTNFESENNNTNTSPFETAFGVSI